MGFVGFVCVPWERDSRGLGLFWLSSVHVNLHHYSYHHIDAKVIMPNLAETWRFTSLYGYSRAKDKIFTWDLMRTLYYHQSMSTLPWLVVGDFNEILCNA